MSFYTSNFARRQMLSTSVGDSETGVPNTRPELTPADNIQAHLYAAQMQGGGTIYLGPYDFQIQSRAQSDKDAETLNYLYIPPGVTLAGVPGMTRIFKKVEYFEEYGSEPVNVKSLGPVVWVGGNKAAIIDCEIDLDTDTNLPDGATLESFNGRHYRVYIGGTTYEVDYTASPFEEEKANSIVYVTGSWNRVQDCWIGAPYLLNGVHPSVRKVRGVYADSSGIASNIISGNNLRTLCAANSEGIYIRTGGKGSSITGNVAEYDDTHAISVHTNDEIVAGVAHNAINGNVGGTTKR